MMTLSTEFKLFFLPILATKDVLVLLANQPILLGRMIQSLRHLLSQSVYHCWFHRQGKGGGTIAKQNGRLKKLSTVQLVDTWLLGNVLYCSIFLGNIMEFTVLYTTIRNYIPCIKKYFKVLYYVLFYAVVSYCTVQYYIRLWGALLCYFFYSLGIAHSIVLNVILLFCSLLYSTIK